VRSALCARPLLARRANETGCGPFRRRDAGFGGDQGGPRPSMGGGGSGLQGLGRRESAFFSLAISRRREAVRRARGGGGTSGGDPFFQHDRRRADRPSAGQARRLNGHFVARPWHELARKSVLKARKRCAKSPICTVLVNGGPERWEPVKMGRSVGIGGRAAGFSARRLGVTRCVALFALRFASRLNVGDVGGVPRTADVVKRHGIHRS